MATLSKYFEQAQLSIAAYALDLQAGMSGRDNTEYVLALRTAGLSQTQAENFASAYEVIDQYTDPDSGFSGTVFWNSETGIHIAIRGTEMRSVDDWATNFGDLLADGIAIDQALAMFNWVQRLRGFGGDEVNGPDQVVQYDYIPAYNDIETGEFVPARIATTTTAATGELYGLTAPISVTGHSLGGHLAVILSRLAPNLIDSAYTYNAPGFDHYGTGLTSEGFFDLLKSAPEPVPPVTGEIGTAWDTGIMTHLAVEGDGGSGFGNMPGVEQIIFSEEANQGSVDAHGKEALTDGLALYDLFVRLDPVLDSTTFGIPHITSILEATASDPFDSLEYALDDVRRIVLGPDIEATPLGDGAAAREQFYQNYYMNQSRRKWLKRLTSDFGESEAFGFFSFLPRIGLVAAFG